MSIYNDINGPSLQHWGKLIRTEQHKKGAAASVPSLASKNLLGSNQVLSFGDITQLEVFGGDEDTGCKQPMVIHRAHNEFLGSRDIWIALQPVKHDELGQQPLDFLNSR